MPRHQVRFYRLREELPFHLHTPHHLIDRMRSAAS